jgi:hypothetical protein
VHDAQGEGKKVVQRKVVLWFVSFLILCGQD